MLADCELKVRTSLRLLSDAMVDSTNVSDSQGQVDNLISPGKRTQRPTSPLTSPPKRESTCSVEQSSPEHVSSPVNVLDIAPVPTFNFKHTCTVREEHGCSIFGVAFNSSNRSRPSDPLLFATVAAHYVTIYQCVLKSDQPNTDSPPIILLQSFTDPAGDEEEFYCCAWSRDTSGNTATGWWTDCAETKYQSVIEPHQHQPRTNHSSASLLPPHQQLVAAAGKRGVIRILCPSQASCPVSLVGHGSAINELRFHPRDPALLFSFSKDYTARLWNISSHVLVCVFGGAEGHRAEILHGDISLSGDLLLTAGMDHCLKIWRLNTPELANTVIDSFSYRPHGSKKPFPFIVQHFPEFSSRDVHGNYIDCARWFGALVISKSCENNVTLWKPGGLDEGTDETGTESNWINCAPNSFTEVGGLSLPSRLQPIMKDGSVQAMPGVPTENKITILHQLDAPDCNLWYIRFDLDLINQILALGTGTGLTRIYLWDLSSPESALELPPQILHVPSIPGTGTSGVPLNQSAIRQTRFANEGKTLLCVGDNGLIVRFDRI